MPCKIYLTKLSAQRISPSRYIFFHVRKQPMRRDYDTDVSCEFCELSKEHLFYRTPLGDFF